MQWRKQLDVLNVVAGQKVKEREYWLNQLSGDLVFSHFPYDYNIPGEDQRCSGEVKFRLPTGLFSELMKLSGGSDYTLHIILTAGWVILLDKYSGHKDILVGTSIYKQEIEAGFINTVLPLRNQLKDGMTFKELLLQLRENIIGAIENYSYPMEILLADLDIPVSGKDFPLFDVVILVENIHDRRYIRHINPNTVISFLRTDECIEGTFTYNSSLFARATIERIISHFTQLLRGVLFNSDASVSAVNILPEEEKKQILLEFNDTAGEFPGEKAVDQLFAEQVTKRPDGIAAAERGTDGCHAITYKELNEKANALAHLLRCGGAERNGIIGIMAERSVEMIVGILGIIKCGCAYLPIDPGYPPARKKYMLKDSESALLLTQKASVDPGENEGFWQWWDLGSVIFLDDRGNYRERRSHIEAGNKPGDLLYVIYTSGTTGKPKGVLVQHKGIVNLIHCHRNVFGEDHSSRMSQVASSSFDAMAFEVWPCLLNGASLFVVDNNTRLDPAKMKEWLIENKITISFQPTMMGELLLKEEWPETGVALRALRVAGDTLKSYPTRPYPFRFYNLYGPTEDSIWTTWTEVTVNAGRKSTKLPGIGKPVGNHRIYILEENFNPVPIGVAGELYISGAGLARGYLNMAELTAEKFVENPFEKGYRMYRSGDLARWLPDGNLEFAGRRDHQVKIRGIRIEVGEVENQLLAVNGIDEALVIALEDIGSRGSKYLCAYIVSNRGIKESQLRNRLLEYLPEHMVPSYFVLLEKFPMTPNGKVDRRALPAPGMKKKPEFVAPGDDIEKKLAEIWADVLEIDRDVVGINDDFFQHGGHSLKVSILAARIHKEFAVNIPLMNLFRMPTIQEISETIKKSPESKFVNITPAEEREYYPLSTGQRRLYILQQMELASISFNMPQFVRLEGELNYGRLETTFEKLINRHDSLRTCFCLVNGEPVQKIYPGVEFKISFYQAENEDDAREIFQHFITPFDLSQVPLLRAGLIKVEGRKHFLMIDIDHVISDGASQGVLIGDFMALYEGEGLPPSRLQYKDYVHWLNRAEQEKVVKEQEDFWLRQFPGNEDIPVLDLPTDYPRPAVWRSRGKTAYFYLDEDLSAALKQLGQAENSTLFITMLAIFYVLLAKLSRQEDIVVGTTLLGRRHIELEKMIGIFTNQLVLRNYPQGEKPFLEFLREVRDRTLMAFENQDYPFEDLVEKLLTHRDPARHPLYDVGFAFTQLEFPGVHMSNLKVEGVEYELNHARIDMNLVGHESGGRIHFALEFSTELFKEETSERLIKYFKTAAEEIVKEPTRKLKDIEILSLDEMSMIRSRIEVAEDTLQADFDV